MINQELHPRIAHEGQVDKAGEPYIGHVTRVMDALDSQTEKTTGILHDLLEDTGYTAADLREMGYSGEIVEALGCLTRRKGEPHEQFIERVKTNPIARKVKVADLEDNLNLNRIPSPTRKDQERSEKYRTALMRLKEQ